MAGPKQRLGFAYRFVASVVRPVLMVITRRDWRGAERIPPVGTGVVVVANHISHADPVTFGHFLWDNGRAPRYLAKEAVFRIPVVGRIISACGQIPVQRESRDAARAYSEAVKAIEAGECVVIYPEGTITRDEDLWPMAGKTGAARVALATGCEVIPAAQWGVQDLLPPYSKRASIFPPKTVHVQVGPPVEMDDLRSRPVTSTVMREATDRIIDAITEQLATIRREVPPAERHDPRTAGRPPVAESPPEDETARPERRPGDGEGTPA